MTRTASVKTGKTRRPSISRSAEPSDTRRAVVIGVSLLAVAVIVAIIMALASGGEDESTSTTAQAARIPDGTPRQVSSIDTTGNPLPLFDSSGQPDPVLGAKAPSITASYFDNTEVTIETDDGTPRVLLFLAHWCPHCQQEVKTLVPWFETNGVPSDVEVVAISTGVDEGAPNYPPSSWLRREAWPVPVLRDSAKNDLAAAYGLTGYPFIVTIAGDGTIVNRTSGGLTNSSWEALLSMALTG